jgi:sorting nexin-29
MNVVSKLYSKVAVNCISPALETECIEDEQGGFRVHRACDEQFFALHTLLRSRKQRGKDTYLMFVDFKKAFDSVPRDKLMEKLLKVGVDGKVLRVIRSLYQGHSARVRVDGQTSRPFDISVGVKQGCVMSTELFKVFVNDLIGRLKAADAGAGVQAEGDAWSVSCLMFADDLVMMSETQQGLQTLADVLAAWCEENELEVNVGKTKVMVVGKASKAQVKLNGERVEVVSVYKYLGLMLSRDLKWTEHVSYVVDKTKRRMAQCHRLLSNKDLPPSTRLHLYGSLILPVMTYGAGLWHLTGHQLRQFETLHLKALKAILGTSATTTTAAVYADSAMTSIEALQQECLLKLAGRIARMAPGRLVRQMYQLAMQDGRDEWYSQLTTALGRHTLALDGTEAEEKWNECVTRKVQALFAEHLQEELAKAVKCSQLRPCLKDGRLQRPAYLRLPSKLSSFYFKLRAGSLRLEIEEGRMKRVAREARLCPLCQGEVEDAEHFLLRCPALDHERHELQQNLDETPSPPSHFSTEVLLGLSTHDGEGASESEEVLRVQLSGLHGMWVKRCTLQHRTPCHTIAAQPPRVNAHRVRQSCATNA